MRAPSLLLALVAAALAATAGLWAARTAGVEAQEISTLYVSGLEIGPGRTAVVRLRNVSTHAADTFTVYYTVRDPRAGVPISRPGAGDGARLAAGDILELDLGRIVDQYRAELEAGPYAGPVQFVAFGAGGSFESFGPAAVVAEALQTTKRATYGVPADWVTE